jgi:hypothetical protein
MLFKLELSLQDRATVGPSMAVPGITGFYPRITLSVNPRVLDYLGNSSSKEPRGRNSRLYQSKHTNNREVIRGIYQIKDRECVWS